MTIRTIHLAAVAAFLLISCPVQSAGSDDEILVAINALGSDSFEKQFDVFYGNPERSTELLISALKPVSRGKYLAGHTPQAVWIVRALRSLTGLDFKARTRETLSGDESHFLSLDAQHRVEFFGTWMSRDSTWIAPHDAQLSIIKQWHTWFGLHAHNYKYPNDQKIDDWYF